MMSVEQIDHTVKLIAADVSKQSTIILCFHTGGIPSDCAPMPRDPLPAIGSPFDKRFARLGRRNSTQFCCARWRDQDRQTKHWFALFDFRLVFPTFCQVSNLND
jgi:hypothetical protein